MAKQDLEKQFHTYLLENPSKVLKGLTVIDDECCLYRPGVLLTRELYSFENIGKKQRGKHFGRIDVIFRYKSTDYCGEIKYEPHYNDDFWDAMKILGYTTYYRWQLECNGGESHHKPAILMPLNRIKLQHKIIAGRLGIALFGIVKEGENFTMCPMNEMTGVMRDVYKEG